jgi:hypothetical protein
MSVKYDVVPQGRFFAVVRTGPKGGKRTVAVYGDRETAQGVRTALWAAAPLEATEQG